MRLHTCGVTLMKKKECPMKAYEGKGELFHVQSSRVETSFYKALNAKYTFNSLGKRIRNVRRQRKNITLHRKKRDKTGDG